MKKFFGGLMMLLGILAIVAMLIPAPKNPDPNYTRVQQACLSGIFLLAGFTLAREPKTLRK